MACGVRHRLLTVSYLCGVGSILAASVAAQTAAPQGANSDPAYQALRNLTLGNEAVSVKNLDLKRDAGTFHLNSGTVCFVPPVNGMVTGAVFRGDGSLSLYPPLESERKSLKLLTRENEFAEKFDRLVLRFTDETYEEIKKAGELATPGCDAGPLTDSQNTTRHKIKWNLEARILAEVMSPNPRGFFLAFIHGKRYEDKEIFELEPNDGRDQVQFRTYNENKWGYWASFNLADSHPKGGFGIPMRIEHQQLDAAFEKSGSLSG